MAGIAGVGGLASGIQSGDIIDAFIEADRAATRLLERRKTTFSARLDAVRGFNTRLLSAQLDIAALKRPTTFQTRTATSSSSAVATATASAGAQAGTYSITVDRKAQAHQVTTGGFASSTDSIGTGDVVIQVGDGAAMTVTMTASNSSLDGLAAAINAKGGDVTAQVINDGSSQPYRLMLTSKKTGEDNQISFDADALTGGTADELQKVVSAVAPGTTSALSTAGLFSGADGPKEYLVEVEADGTAGVVGSNATFRWSSDGGATWTTGVAAEAGELTLSNGVSVSFSAGNVTTGDAFTVRPLQELAAAQDSKVKYGTTGSYVTIESSGNSITGLIGGVTISVAGTGSATITVGSDSGGAREAIDKFVASYNSAISYLNDNSRYDPETGKSGVLMSESDLRRSLDATSRTILGVVPNLPTSMNSVTALGISIDRTSGLLTVDAAKLDAKLAEDPEAVMRLFANSGSTTNTAVQFATLSEKTDVSQDFVVNVLLPASQAILGNTGDLAATTVITAANKTLNLTINGRNVVATLAEGSYTRAQMASQVETAVNGAVTNKADRVIVGLSGDGLELRTALYGSLQSVQVTGGSASASLLLGTSKVNGVDVAATIDGVAATGSGQVLSGVVGQRSEGLRLTVNATAATTATITARKGLGQIAGDRIIGMTDTRTGSVVQKEDGLEDIVDGLAKRITDMDDRLAKRRLRYERMFVQMERLIQQFQSQGNAIAGQISGFENMATSRSRR